MGRGGGDTYIHWMRPLWSRNVGQRVLSESRTNDCRPKVWTHLQTSSWTKTKRVTFSSFTSKHNRRDRPAKWQFIKWLCFADLQQSLNECLLHELLVWYQCIRASVYPYKNQYRGYRQTRQMCPWYVKQLQLTVPKALLLPALVEQGTSVCKHLKLKLICPFLHYFQFLCGRIWISFNWSILCCCSFSSWLHCTYCSVGNNGKFMQSQKLENKVCGVWLQ